MYVGEREIERERERERLRERDRDRDELRKTRNVKCKEEQRQSKIILFCRNGVFLRQPPVLPKNLSL